MIASKNSFINLFKLMNVDITQIPIDNREWINAFSSLGIEVEEIHTCNLSEDDYSVVKVESCYAHPKSDHLHVCKVNDGKQIYTIVCGAPNVHTGMYTIMARLNTIMPDGRIIEPREIRGTSSCGMLCGLHELFPAIAPYMLPIDCSGIIDLEEQGNMDEKFHLAPGAKGWIKYLMLNDDIFDLTLATNAGYLNGILPIALALLAYWNLKYILDVNKIIDREITNATCTDVCGLIKFEDDNHRPDYRIRMILAHNFLKAEDLANAYALKLSHYFAYSFIPLTGSLSRKGLHLVKNEKECLMNDPTGNYYAIPSDTLLLLSNQEVVAMVAVLADEKYVPKFEEHGFYILFGDVNPYHVSQVLKTINYDSYNARLATKGGSFWFANHYMRTLIPSTNECEFLVSSFVMKPYMRLNCTWQELFAKLTSYKDFDESKVIHQLDLIGISYDSDKDCFWIPPYRTDFENDNDLIEEALRFINVNLLTPEPITAQLITNQDTFVYDNVNKVRSYLVNLGCYEVKTYRLTSKKDLHQQYHQEYNDQEQVILNPISSEREVMKHTLFTSLFNIDQLNFSKKNYLVKNIFEVANIYWENNSHTSMILGALFDTDISITDNKVVGGKNLNLSLIFNLLHHLGQIICHEDLNFEIDEDNANEQFVRLYSIRYENKYLGYIGIVNKQFENFVIEADNASAYYLELNLEALCNIAQNVKKEQYHVVDKMPCISRDVNATVAKTFDASLMLHELQHELPTKIHGFSEIRIKDVYAPTNEQTKVITFNYIINPTKTLTKEDIASIEEQIKKAIDNKLN